MSADCRNDFNPDQVDSDNDGSGDVCDMTNSCDVACAPNRCLAPNDASKCIECAVATPAEFVLEADGVGCVACSPACSSSQCVADGASCTGACDDGYVTGADGTGCFPEVTVTDTKLLVVIGVNCDTVPAQLAVPDLEILIQVCSARAGVPCFVVSVRLVFCGVEDDRRLGAQPDVDSGRRRLQTETARYEVVLSFTADPATARTYSESGGTTGPVTLSIGSGSLVGGSVQQQADNCHSSCAACGGHSDRSPIIDCTACPAGSFLLDAAADTSACVSDTTVFGCTASTTASTVATVDVSTGVVTDTGVAIVDAADGSAVGCVALARDPVKGDYGMVTVTNGETYGFAKLDVATGAATVLALDASVPARKYTGIGYDCDGTAYAVSAGTDGLSFRDSRAVFTVDFVEGFVPRKCMFGTGSGAASLGFSGNTGVMFSGSASPTLRTFDALSTVQDDSSLCVVTTVDAYGPAAGAVLGGQSVVGVTAGSVLESSTSGAQVVVTSTAVHVVNSTTGSVTSGQALSLPEGVSGVVGLALNQPSRQCLDAATTAFVATSAGAALTPVAGTEDDGDEAATSGEGPSEPADGSGSGSDSGSGSSSSSASGSGSGDAVDGAGTSTTSSSSSSLSSEGSSGGRGGLSTTMTAVFVGAGCCLAAMVVVAAAVVVRRKREQPIRNRPFSNNDVQVIDNRCGASAPRIMPGSTTAWVEDALQRVGNEAYMTYAAAHRSGAANTNESNAPATAAKAAKTTRAVRKGGKTRRSASRSTRKVKRSASRTGRRPARRSASRTGKRAQRRQPPQEPRGSETLV